MNIEKILKAKLNKNGKNVIIVNGNEEYINIVNDCIEKYMKKNDKKMEKDKIKIIDFYEVRDIQREHKRDIR